MLENAGAQVVRRNWWLMALRGVFAIIFGLIALFAPRIALLAFIFVFAAFALINGIIAVYTAIQERGSLSRWGWVLFEGILSIIAGIIAFVYPGLTALVLLYIVASWAIVTGILEIVAAFAIRGFALFCSSVQVPGYYPSSGWLAFMVSSSVSCLSSAPSNSARGHHRFQLRQIKSRTRTRATKC
jgi:Short repeat of unknown function (DUF308)